MTFDLERHWYRSTHSVLTFLLLPLSWLFCSIVSARRFLYRIKIKRTVKCSAPIIVVGNITVGGTGKTPFVIWLAALLKQQDFKPGIVSRGMGGKQQIRPRWVDENSDPALVGDEAILLARRSGCPVVVGVDRVAAVKELLSKTDCNIVLSDDGLQHYRLGRDIEIAVIDGARGLGNSCFLPAGPLRESPKRLTEVDFVVHQQTGHTSFSKAQSNEFAMYLKGVELVSLIDENHKIPFDQLQEAHAVAAIGNPERFFNSLRAQNVEIHEHVFPDHYLYLPNDFKFNDNLPIVMTEKDAVKCRSFADGRFWYLPVEMQIDKGFEEQLMKKISVLSSS